MTELIVDKQARAAQQAEFNQEPGCRLASLDRCEHQRPDEVRIGLQGKFEDRRQKRR